MMKTLLATAIFCLALNANAACPVKRPNAVPVLPDGTSASVEDMHRARLAAEMYLLQSEAYIDCKVMNRRQHEALVAKLDAFSELYNEEVIKFQVRRNMVAEK